MSASWSGLPLSTLAARFLVMLLGASLKASLIFTMVFVATRLMRDSLPRLRHLLWTGVLSSFLLILLLSPLSPPLLPLPRPIQATPDGLYGTVSRLLLPQGGVAGFPDFRVCSEAALAKVSPRGPAWALPLLLLWIAGALASSLKVAVGSVRVRLLAAEARRCPLRKAAWRHERVAGELALAAGIRRRVRVLESPSCGVPFVRGILRPQVMLPSAARAWKPQRLRAVLLHELRHIKCADSLSQGIARGICSLFWFVPFAWMAYSFLCAEQEKCCDAGVVGNGIPPGAYAACLLAAARCSQEPAPIAGLYSPSWRKRVLLDRIQSILERGRTGKKRWLIFALTVSVVCALLLLGGAGGNRPLPIDQAYDRFVGVWVNEVYPGDMFKPEVRVLRPDHVGVDRLYPGLEAVAGTWAIVVRRAWNDARGSTYCQFSWIYTDGWAAGESWRRGVGLMRVDKAGRIWEANFRWGAVVSPFPEQIDTEANQYWYRYFIYYRKEEGA